MPSENPSGTTELAVVRRHRAILTNLTRLAAHRGLSPDEFFQELVVRVAQAIEITYVKLLRYRPDLTDLFVEAGYGWKPGMVGTTAFPADMSSPVGRTFRTGQPIVIEDTSNAEGYRIPASLLEHGIVALLNVPIMVDGAAWGVLEADSAWPRDFSHDTEEFLVAAAALAGMVLARAAIEDEEEKAVAAGALTLQRQELLLSEMHHRVRNNFQMLLAMISTRMAKFPHAEGRALAGELSGGVMAMSLAHEQLAMSPAEGTLVNLRTYLGSPAVNLEKSDGKIMIHVATDELHDVVENAVALGLIVNEAVRNAIKHAFPHGEGEIRIELCETGLAEICLAVGDNGAGRKAAGREGSGTRLVKALARQLGGRAEWVRQKKGTLLRVVFPRRVQERDAVARPARNSKPSEENKRAWGKMGFKSRQ